MNKFLIFFENGSLVRREVDYSPVEGIHPGNGFLRDLKYCFAQT